MTKTLKDIIWQIHPNRITNEFLGGVYGCPQHYACLAEYVTRFKKCEDERDNKYHCEECWNRPAIRKEV